MSTLRLLVLLLLSLLPFLALRAQTQAFAYGGGVVWIAGGSVEISFAQGAEPAQMVWTSEDSIGRAGVAGSRLVAVTKEGLAVFSPGSWTPKLTPLAEDTWIVALATSADTALACDAAGGVWRLEKDGSWRRRDADIQGVGALAHFRGLWVAVGATPGEEPDEEDAGPANYGMPSWQLRGQEPLAWWSTDGVKWQPATLPENLGGKLVAVAGGATGWLAVNVDGSVLLSKDGKTWQAGESSESFVQEETKEVAALGGAFWVKFGYDTDWQRTVDGRTWETLPLAPGARRAALFMKEGKVHAVGHRKEDRDFEVAAVEDFGVVPGPDAAELAALKAAEEKALAEKQAAEAKAAAERKAAEEKARVEKQARDMKLQAVAASLADLGGVFQGTANGLHWDGERLLVSAYGGIYRSGDGAKFELWIPSDRIGFQGLREAGGRLWTWNGSPTEGRSHLMGFPPNAGGKLPVYQTAAGRITGIAGEGARLAFITDAGNGCYVYASDDGGDRWSFSPVKAGDLLPMQYGYLPNMVGPGLAYGNGRWVAVGRRADNTTAAAVSTDRVNWKVVPVGGPKGGLMRVVFANGRFVASGQKDFTPNAPWFIASSADGETWELATLPGESPGLVDVAGGRLYAHNRTGLFTSDDTRTWRRVAAHAPLDAVTLGEIGGRIVLVGEPVTEGRAGAPQYQLVQVARPAAADLAAASDVATPHVVAALEKFDAAIMATTEPAGMGKPLGELITALDRLAPGPIADAVAAVAAEDMPAYGGVRGTFDLMMSLPDPRLRALNSRLTDDQRKMIQIFAAAHNARLHNRPVDTLAVAAAEATWPAGEFADDFRGPQQSGELDVGKVRAAAFTGNRGAMHDLSLIYSHGAGAPKHGTLGGFWGRVHRRLDPTMPPHSAGQEALRAHLAATGSPYFSGMAALAELDAAAGRLTDDLLARLERAARDGLTLAQDALDELQADIRQRREGGLAFAQIHAAKPSSGAATAASWFNAASQASAAGAEIEAQRLKQPAAKPPGIRTETVRTEANGIEVRRVVDAADLAMSISSKIGFAAGLYTLTGGDTVYFSPDARDWEEAPIEIPLRNPDTAYRVDRVLHDGLRWAAVVFNARPEVLVSTDRKEWKPGGDWKLSGRHLAARDGQFWTAYAPLGIGTYYRGRFEAKAGEYIREWDGQVQDRLESEPRAVMQDGRRLFLLTDDGRLLSSDNNEYWEQIGDLGTREADGAFYAEGADAAVAVVVKGTVGSARAGLFLQKGDGLFRQVTTPFENVKALAYGLGRFVVIGTKGAWPGEHALYESVDGEAWTRVTVLRGAPESLAYGPAGFVTNWTEIGPGQMLLLYRPPGAVEKPARVRPPTPIPPVRFRDFGTNSSGRGKYRTDEGPKTPDQRRIAELAALVPKANAGDAAAQRELAFALLEGRHAYGNPWRAELWFKEAMAAGDAQAGRGYAQLLMQWKPDTPAAQIEALFRDSAGHGDEAAQAWLAHRETYLANIVPAEAGDVEATMRVAPLLLKGDGVASDPLKALRLLRLAGDKKHVPALLMLAEHHEQEVATGVTEGNRAFSPADYTRFLTAAGDLGQVPALRKLVTAYATGAHDVTKDEKLAYASALKLANLGDAEGMAMVGGALLEGRIVPKDPGAGADWIRQAAAKGHAQAKAWVEQQAGGAQRSAARPPQDGRVGGVTPEVFAALQLIQSAPAPELGDTDLRALFGAVWFDAEYSLAEEDLAQELAAAPRPVVVTAADGRTLAFTKALPAAGAAGFARVLPVGFNAGDLHYYFTLWQQTANAGLLVAATRLGEPQKVTVRQALAKGLFDMAAAPKPRNAQALAEYFKQLKASHAAANPALRKAFRDLIAQAVEMANQAAKQAGHDSLLPYVNFAWE